MMRVIFCEASKILVTNVIHEVIDTVVCIVFITSTRDKRQNTVTCETSSILGLEGDTTDIFDAILGL